MWLKTSETDTHNFLKIHKILTILIFFEIGSSQEKKRAIKENQKDAVIAALITSCVNNMRHVNK